MKPKHTSAWAGLVAGLLLLTSTALAQNKTVTGKVTDSKGGFTLAGVTVTVKGAQTGTSTNGDGVYTISVPANGTLVFSSVGYTDLEVPVANKTTIDVNLVPSAAQNLDEVVVVGYGTARRKDLTGATTSVKAKDFNQGVIAAPDQLIQGKVAGLQVVANNGAPGAATTIRIRGNSSLRSGNNPLFVVDGIPLDGRLARPGLNIPDVGNTPESNPLYFFNANDIASMEVQKDASATAIYGSRAANGVVQIITKQGSSGPAKIDFAASLGVSNILRRFEVMDAAGYKAAAQAYNVQLPQGDNADVNALDEILQTGITQNYNLGIGGGNENGRYRFSFGYMDQNGIIKRTNLRRFTINANGQYKLLKSRKLSLDYNLYLGQARENIAPITNDAGFLGNLIGMALQWRPTEPLYLNNDKNRPNIIPGSSVINPVAFQRGYTDISNISSMFGVVGVGYKIVKDLDYKMNVSLTKQTGIRQSAMNRWITLPAIENRGLGAVGNSQMTTTVIQHTLQYNKKISQNFNINSIIGYEYQDFGWSGSSARGIGFANDDVPLYNIIQNAPAAGRQISAFEDPDASIQSYFARAILNFQDKYLLTATFRADGSSRFGDNNKYGYFPSLAARWNLHSEEFMKNSNTFQNLSLRASWGVTGNQAFPAGSAQTQWGYADNGGGLVQLNVANPDLRWESTKQLNIGADFTLAKNRLFGSVDYFRRVTSDILFAFAAIQPAPAVSVWKNIEDATITNSGVELSLGSTLINKKDLVWNFNINGTWLRNEFNNYSGPPILTGAINGQGLTGAFAQRIDNGQPLNAFYTRNFLGFDRDGLAQYADNENPQFVGDPNPNILLGISTDVSIKKLSIVLNMNGAFGHQLYNNTLNAVLPIGNLGTRNIAKSLLDLNPRENFSNPIKASSRYLEKGDFLRLANLSFSYALGNIGSEIKNASVFVTGQNLFVITKFSGFDPEVNTDKNIGGVPSFGIEYLPYPSARTFMFGFRFGL